MRTGGSGSRRIAIAAGLVLAVVYLAMALSGDLRDHPERFLVLAGVAAIAFGAAAVAVTRPGVRGRVGIVLLGALVFRAILLPTVPTLSDDVWRYLWDGHVASAGIDPFRHAPDAPELLSLRNDVWEKVNHRQVPTIYPPAAQLAFRAADALGGLRAWKVLVLFFDGLTLLAILRMLRRSGRDPALVVLYAWNPLVLIEFAGNAHVDAAALAATVWAIAASREGRERWALGMITVGVAFKVFPIVLLPLIAFRVRDRRSWAVPLVVAAALALPYAEAGLRAISSGGLRVYASNWEFNAPLFEFVRCISGSAAGTRRALGLALFTFALTLAIRDRNSAHPETPALATLGALLLVSPTVHPWYLTWIVPLLPIVTGARRAPWLLLSQTVLLSYAVLIPLHAVGEWRLPAWALAFEWAPFYGLLVWQFSRQRRSRRVEAT